MVNTKSLFAGLLVASSLVGGISAAQAGEVGVSNKYSDGYSNGSTHVDFTSNEIHQGVEANWATSDKTFASNEGTNQNNTQYGSVLSSQYNNNYSSYDYYGRPYYSNTNQTSYAVVPVSSDSASTNKSETVHAASGFSSSGTYFTQDMAKGFTDSTNYSNFNEHTTSAFSNP